SDLAPLAEQQILDGVGAHAGREVLAEAVTQLAVVLVVGQQLLGRHVLEHVEDALEHLDPGGGLLAHVLERALRLVPGLGALVGLGPLGLHLRGRSFRASRRLSDLAPWASSAARLASSWALISSSRFCFSTSTCSRSCASSVSTRGRSS